MTARTGFRASAIGPYASALVGDNILLRVLRLLDRPGVRLGTVVLDKHLPVAAGIGGGSADAAALLRAVRRANPAVADAPWWREVAEALGADVPVCVASRPALLTGTGHLVAPIAAFPTLHGVLANPQAPVPADKTGQVFRALRLQATAGTGDGPPVPLRLRDAAEVLAYVSARDNSLTGPAARVVPAIPAVLAALSGLAGCRVARMSGAGPTCFGLFDTLTAAEAAAAALKRQQPGWWVVATRLG